MIGLLTPFSSAAFSASCCFLLPPADNDILFGDLGPKALEIQDEVVPHVHVYLHVGLINPMRGGFYVIYRRPHICCVLVIWAIAQPIGLTCLITIPHVFEDLE